MTMQQIIHQLLFHCATLVVVNNNGRASSPDATATLKGL